MKVCAVCGTKIGKKDRFCPKCGSSSTSEEAPKSKFCLYCGETLDAKAKFCRKCGKSCDGNVPLGFLNERKEGNEGDSLDFLNPNSPGANLTKPVMTPEEREKERATLAKFEAQVRAKTAEKRLNGTLPTITPVAPTIKKSPLPSMPMPGMSTQPATPAPAPVVAPAAPVAQAPAPAAPKPVVPAIPKDVPELIEEEKAIKQAEEAKKALELALAAAEKALENAEKAAAAAKAAADEADRAQKAAEEAKKNAAEAIEEAEKKKVIADEKRAELEKKRIEEEERLKKEEEERKRKEEEERLRREEEERKRKEEEERRLEEERKRREEEERKRKEEEERLRREEEERKRKEEEERRRLEEEERKRREEEERKRKEEEERLRREEEERIRKEEEAKRKAEEERRKNLENLHKEVLKAATNAIAKYDKNPDAERPFLEESLDRLEDMYKKMDPDMDVSDTEDAYHAIQERLGIMYYREGAYKLAMPLIDAAVKSGSKKASIYKSEWYSKNRAEIPKEPDYLKNMALDALEVEDITDDEKLLLYLTLAKTYHDGLGCKRDLEEAFHYYSKAADMENAYAYAKLGQCYLYGEGVKKDGKLAFEWSQKAADEGNETGIRNLAVCYDFGTGTKKNADAAIEWYKKLLDKLGNDRFAMFRIALCLADPDREFGRKPTEAECREAYDFATRAQAGGEENANYILGYLHMVGKGTVKDYNKAVSFFTSAANYGNSKAKDKLKMFVKNGNNYTLK